MKPEDRPGYGGAAIALHWLTAVLVVVVFTLGPGGSETRVYPAAKDFGPSPRWMRVASRVVQGLLYLLLFAVPLTAIAGAWLEGHPLTLGALGEIAPPIAENRPLGHKIAEAHTWLGDTMLWMAGFHAAAALFHHFVLRDDVLLSMLPARWRPGASG